jgi:hypothetical protein
MPDYSSSHSHGLPSRHVEVAIIGAGSAGMSAYRAALQSSASGPRPGQEAHECAAQNNETVADVEEPGPVLDVVQHHMAVNGRPNRQAMRASR